MITSPNKRIYIGSTINTIQRFKLYKSKVCKQQVKLYNSFIKYGVENHLIEIIWSGDFKDMYKYERLCGDYYEVITKGLNCILPGYNDIPQVISEETKEKIRIKLTGIKFSKERLEKHILSCNNKVYTEEHKDKLRKSTLLRVEEIKKINAKKVIHIPTNKEFESIVETAKFFNFSTDYISSQLSGRRKNKLNLKFK